MSKSKKCKKGKCTVETSANELENGQVSFISLVNRGANRIPIHSIKSEDGMLDLPSLGSIFQRDKKEPTVSAYVVSAEKEDAAIASLANNGIDVVEVQKSEDGGTVLVVDKSEFNPAKAVLVQADADGDLVGVHQNIDKSLMMYEPTTSFGEAMKARKFFPNFNGAQMVLEDVVYDITSQEKSKEEMQTALEASLSEYTAYVSKMFAEIPEQFFSPVSMVDKSEETQEEPTEGEETATEEDTLNTEESTPPVAEETSTAEEPTPAEETDGEVDVTTDKECDEDLPEGEAVDITVAAPETSVEEETEVDKSDGETLATVLTTMKSISQQLDGMGIKLTALEEGQTTLAGRIDKTEEAVNGTVLTSDMGDARITTANKSVTTNAFAGTDIETC
jgi:hypothetical protein